MDTVINLYKPVGETPLERIERLRSEDAQYANAKLSYAGRLDPMADGVLLALADTANKGRDAYLNLPKQYRFTVLCGVQSDSYDALGLVDRGGPVPARLEERLRTLARAHTGTIRQKFPPFSAKHVNGKPLFVWARAGELNEAMLPERHVSIHAFDVHSVMQLSARALQRFVHPRIDAVSGEFRQSRAHAAWERLLSEDAVYPAAVCTVRCSSGTYVRSLAHEFGKQLGCGAIALTITRERVGAFDIENARR